MRTYAIVFVVALASCSSVVNFETPRESGEQCSDGVDNDGNGAMDCEDPGCAGTLECLGCGDGTADANEECDDNNTMPNDGCSPTCKIEVCGDGVVNGDEPCDDGNDDDTDACLVDCTNATCGDGFLRAGTEQCDDGNAALNDGCTTACVVERCGDGTPQTGAVIQGLEFMWLSTACGPPRPVELRMGPVVIAAPIGDESCSCAPGFRTFFTETNQILDGFNDFTVNYSGADQFLGWAMVVIHTTAGDVEIVIHEGVPGAALARANTMCGGGFDENVPEVTVTAAVSVFEECDDGNTTNDDGCDNDCRPSAAGFQ